MEEEKLTREELHRSSNNKKSKIIISVISTLFLLVGLFFVYQFTIGDWKKQEVQAQKLTEELFLDDSLVYLAEDINQDKLDKAEKAVEELNFLQPKKLLGQKVNNAKKKFDVVEEFEEIYGVEDFVKGEKIQELDVFQEDKKATEMAASCDKIRKNLDEVKDYTSEGDALVNKLEEQYRKTSEQVQTLVKIEEDLETINVDINDKETSLKASSAVCDLEVNLDKLGSQPKLKTLEKNIDDSVEKLSSKMLTLYEKDTYDEDTIKKIFESRLLASKLSATDMNIFPVAALTFDDGPNPEITPQVLEILDKYDIKATFFVLGANVDEYPELVKRLVDEGHAVGNHTYTHPILSNLSDEEVLQEINWTNESIYDATGGYEAKMYRMPYGAGGARVINLLSDYKSILWNVDPEDWLVQDADMIYNTIIETIKPHSIILLHDTHQASVDALERVIITLKDMGYQFVLADQVDIGYDHFPE